MNKLGLAGAGLASVAWLGPLWAQRPPTPSYSAVALRAFVYDNQDGTFSDDVVPGYPAQVFLRDDGSGGALVVVELRGKPGSYVPGRKLRFTTREANRVILDRTQDVGLFRDDGRWFAGFWLFGAHCVPVTVSAHLLGQSDSSSVDVSIPFTCGERAPPAPPAPAGKGLPGPGYRIAALRAFLFERTFSENVVGQGGELWNIGPVGTFVVVEVRGPAGSVATERKLQLIAAEDRKVVLDRTVPVAELSGDGRYFAGFWVYAGGCVTLMLRARLIGQADSAGVRESVPFACGE